MLISDLELSGSHSITYQPQEISFVPVENDLPGSHHQVNGEHIQGPMDISMTVARVDKTPSFAWNFVEWKILLE